jgi:hypothetical protein
MLAPVTVPVTFTETAQLALAASEPPDRLMLVEFAAAVTVPPLQLLNTAGVLATFNPPPSVSENAMPLIAFATLGLVIEKVTVVVPFSRMLLAPNDLVIVGDTTVTTLSVAVLLVVPVPPSVEVTALVVLGLEPAVVPVTLTVTEQLPLATSVPPDKLIELEPATAVTVPPQLLITPGVEATTKPETSVSEKPIPLSALATFGLLIPMTTVVELPTPIVVVPNDLLIVGGSAPATPVPVNVTVPSVVEPAALTTPCNVNEPTDTGLNNTRILQWLLAPDAVRTVTSTWQSPDWNGAILKLPELSSPESALIVTDPGPAFVTMIVCAALEVPTACVPKSIDDLSPEIEPVPPESPEVFSVYAKSGRPSLRASSTRM